MMLEDVSCGRRLDSVAFGLVSQRAVLECLKWNTYDDGACKLCDFPLIIGPELATKLSGWAEALDAEASAAEAELLGRLDLQTRLGLPWRMLWALRRAVPPHDIRSARYDFHPLEGGGFAITEGNVDVCGGYNEASGVTRIFAEHVPGAEPGGDPAKALATAVAGAVGDRASVGCMHITNFTDDHQVVRFIARELEKHGLHTVCFGPNQLRWEGSRACALIGTRIVAFDAVFRFFPADWLPQLPASSKWWRAVDSGTTLWVNPVTSVLTQSKRFPLTWNRLNVPLSTWRRLMPETRSPRDLDRDAWVIKPAFGYEGYRIAMPGVTAGPEVQSSLLEARWIPWRWAAQRRFRAATIRTPDGLRFPCIGVYTVAGRMAGFYGRLSARPLIDDKAQDVVVLVRR